MTDQDAAKAIEAVLDVARWAPSGDNAQPWSFRVTGAREVTVSVRRTNPSIYEYRQGEPTLISAGGLLENIRIAAPYYGLTARWRYAGSNEGVDRIVITFEDNTAGAVSDLVREIPRRSVDRRPFRTDALTAEQKKQLSEALDPDIQVQWYESLADRRKIAAVSAMATRIRLAIPETFDVHRGIVDWEKLESEEGIPARALGLDPLTLILTRWSMANWGRTRLMNRLGAPSAAALQMDLLPGLFCGAYLAIRLQLRRGDPARTLAAGQAVQRFWLTATKLGLVMQPCVAILAFWTYAAEGRDFTVLSKAQGQAGRLAAQAEAMFGKNDDIVFLARIGRPRAPSASRSIRMPLTKLLRHSAG